MHQRSESRFAGLLTAAFVVLTLPRLVLHELWRDEAWLWLVVRESPRFIDLFEPLTRSGQGYLFPVLCWLAGQVWTSPGAMQLVHLLLAAGAVWAFTRWAPFGRSERALFVLGYLPFYEYAVISRHYAAGALLLWLACASAGRPVLLGLLLGLLCQTTVYGYILALALAAGWLFDRRRRPGLPGLGLFLIGAVAGIVQLIPRSGTSFAPTWRFDWDLEHAALVARLPWRAFVPLPRFGLHFWNTNVLDPWLGLQSLAGPLSLGMAAALLWRRKAALVTFCIGGLGLLAFSYVKYIGVLRHHGHWWLLFAAALWLGGGFQEDRRSWRSRALLALLIVHVAAGAYASVMDLRHPFSNGAATAELIRSEGLDRHPLLGHREPPAASVALVLGRPLYSPSRGVFTTHPDWGPRQRELKPREVRCAARELARREGEDVVLVLNWEPPPWEEVEPVGERTGAIEASEDYRLYLLRLDRLEATGGAAGCPASG